MKLATSANLSLDTFISWADIVRDAGRQEIAMAFGIEPTTGSSIYGKKFATLNEQKQSAGQVQFSQETVCTAEKDLQKQWLTYAGAAHSHIESNNHAHGLSQTDKDMITQSIDQTRSQLYPLFFAREDGGVDLKMYNNNHQEVDITVAHQTAKIISIDKDNQLEQAA